jgi:hypothetical protein
MADNITATQGAGTTLATDEIGAVHYPRVKLSWGADGTADDVSAADPLPVVQTGTPALPTGASTAANQATANTALAAIQTAVEALDNTVSGSELQVDIVSSALPSGAATAANQATANTALAAIQTSVEILDNAISGSEMQVDIVSSALPTGAATAANQATANTALAAIQTSVEILDNAISGSEMQVDIVAALPAGNNNIGDVDVASLPALAAGTNVVGYVGLEARTSGGLSVSRVISGASTNATVAKASAGQVYGWYCSNTNDSPRYVKLYNTSSSPTVGTDTPTHTILVPGNSGSGCTATFPHGIAFSTGISYAITAVAADNDTTAVAANEIIVHIHYK